MATVIKTTFRLKRGTAARWAELNPVLDQGEPGFVYDQNKLKIGDGIHAWNDLPYIEGSSKGGILNFDTKDEFPLVGEPDILYKAAQELSLYQYNTNASQYERLCDGRSIDDIKILNGGRADGID